MKTEDYSKEIFENFFSAKDKVVIVSLKDGSEIEGAFVSFSHGDENSGHFIERWHFVETKDIEKYNLLFTLDGSDEVGNVILQKDILKVRFKE